eukprot:Lankesteria_metandrocarpae@DN9009_c0_g1_i1.p1
MCPLDTIKHRRLAWSDFQEAKRHCPFPSNDLPDQQPHRNTSTNRLDAHAEPLGRVESWPPESSRVTPLVYDDEAVPNLQGPGVTRKLFDRIFSGRLKYNGNKCHSGG